jgi:hypothetical protein
MIGVLAEWACQSCHVTGLVDPANIAMDEVEHCLTGCNGSLRVVRIVDEGLPAIPSGPPVRYVRD